MRLVAQLGQMMWSESEQLNSSYRVRFRDLKSVILRLPCSARTSARSPRFTVVVKSTEDDSKGANYLSGDFFAKL